MATRARTKETLSALKAPVASTRIGALFNAHPYPTKINVAAAAGLILSHTAPGDVVFDGFSGSGVVGLAASLLGRPEDPQLSSLQESDGNWGERDAVLYDLSKLATFISGNLINPPDPDEFRLAAERLTARLQEEVGFLYRAAGVEGEEGVIRHVIWTEHVFCPGCGAELVCWDLAVRLDPAEIRRVVQCTTCLEQFRLHTATRVTARYRDPILNVLRHGRKRTPAMIYGATGTANWRRPATERDVRAAARARPLPLREDVPVRRLMDRAGRWGELHRRGYHFGLEYVHDFYSWRNLTVIARAWKLASEEDPPLRDALRFWVSSYNAAHSTLMTRVVAKKGAADLAVTSAQPAALYVSAFPVEKNIIRGLERKARTIAVAFRSCRGRSNNVEIRCASSLSTHLPDDSVDYILTDPPFGNNIQYSEVNFISEAWLGTTTDSREEVIVSPSTGKTLGTYERLLTDALREAFRLLKPGRPLTLVFHSSDREVWNAVTRAYRTAGFTSLGASILDKTQGSFKQVTTAGAVQKDPVLFLVKPARSDAVLKVQPQPDIWEVVADRLRHLDSEDLASPRHLYSYTVGHYAANGWLVPYDAEDFYRELTARFRKTPTGTHVA